MVRCVKFTLGYFKYCVQIHFSHLICRNNHCKPHFLRIHLPPVQIIKELPHMTPLVLSNSGNAPRTLRFEKYVGMVYFAIFYFCYCLQLWIHQETMKV